MQKNFLTSVIAALWLCVTFWQSQAAYAPMPMGSKRAISNCDMMCMATSRSAGDTAMNKTMMDMMKANAGLKLSGEQDRDFMLLMIAHHQAALDMARTQLAHGKHPQLQALARNILNTQQKEIQEMRSWLHEWYRQ